MIYVAIITDHLPTASVRVCTNRNYGEVFGCLTEVCSFAACILKFATFISAFSKARDNGKRKTKPAGMRRALKAIVLKDYFLNIMAEPPFPPSNIMASAAWLCSFFTIASTSSSIELFTTPAVSNDFHLMPPPFELITV